MFAALKLETTGFTDPHRIVPQEVFVNPVAVRNGCRWPVVLRTQLTLHAMFERKCNRLYEYIRRVRVHMKAERGKPCTFVYR